MEQAYPLQWPMGRPRTPRHKVGYSAFDVTPSKAQAEMLAEIKRMGGRMVVISSNRRVKNDGSIYAKDLGRDPEDSGVAVYFERKGNRVCFACDQYLRIWENMRAIGGAIHNSRHERIRWTAGQECGEGLFEEGVEFDGLTLTVEVSGRDDALAMIKAIEAI